MKAGTILIHKPNTPKSFMLVVGSLPPTTIGDDVRLNIATGVLGTTKQSRLFKAIRYRLRATYGFYARMHDFTRHFRILAMSGEVETAQLQRALDTVGEVYEEFRKSGIGFIEFPIAKRFYLQRIENEMKKPESVSYMLMENRLNGHDVKKFEALAQRINDLDRGDVNKMIKATYPPFRDMLRIIVTPDRDAIKDACVVTDISQWKKCFE